MKVLLSSLAVLMVCMASFYALQLDREDWGELLLWASAVAAISGAWAKWGSSSFSLIFAGALVVRLVIWWAPSTPNLSEDWVRYAWDGWILGAGEWPSQVVPNSWSSQWPDRVDANAAWMLREMNSADYSGVYPPVAELLFAVPWWLGVDSPLQWWRVYQGLLVLFDLWAVGALMFLLRRWKRPRRLAAGYAFHPLVLMEGVGNGHLELVVIGMAVSGALLWPHSKNLASAASWLAIAVKWLPVLALPAWVVWRWPRRRVEWPSWLILGISSIFFAFLAWSSMRLFANQFEFNAAPYYAVRNAFMHFSGYNPIAWLGPCMMLAGGWAVVVAALNQRWSLAEKWTAGWGLWLFFATTVHPWYLLYLIPLGLFTNWIWPAVASVSVLVSYAHYESLPCDDMALALFFIPTLLAAIWDGYAQGNYPSINESQ